MVLHLPLLLLVALFGYLGVRLSRVPLWLVLVLLLGGYLSSGTFLGNMLHAGATAGAAMLGSATR